METTLNRNVQKETDVHRKKLLADLPVKEFHLNAGRVTTSYLEGGGGTPLVLLHGPGESAVWWMRVIPELVKKYRIIVPDLPGHGSSEPPREKFTKDNILAWLDELIYNTCTTPPVLVGHVIGGAIAARFAAQHGEKLKQLILVDSLGLSAFRPDPRFAFEFLRFLASPTEKSYSRFLPQCMYDVNELSRDMRKYWQPFLSYNLASAKNPKKKSAAKGIMHAMSGKIPGDTLDRIKVPVTLIWGRHDKANRLKVAIKASEKYGWPLHIIEDTRDDPKLERPDAFVKALQSSVDEPLAKRQDFVRR